jgi:hypothetical protein
MSETPEDDVDQDAGPPVGAPAPDPGGEPATPSDGSESGRVEPPESAGHSDD